MWQQCGNLHLLDLLDLLHSIREKKAVWEVYVYTGVFSQPCRSWILGAARLRIEKPQSDPFVVMAKIVVERKEE